MQDAVCAGHEVPQTLSPNFLRDLPYKHRLTQTTRVNYSETLSAVGASQVALPAL